MPYINAVGETIHSYIWSVLYTDGTGIPEHDIVDGAIDPNAPSHGFAQVDSRRVKAIHLLPTVTGLPPHIIDVPEGAQGFFVRVHKINVSMVDGAELARGTIVKCGWKKDGLSVHTYVHEDGTVIISTNGDLLG